ncbi:hypothetical protein PoB_004679200 [Plakobranchus ocellatus]|uniref:Uncharacterized protein n=1 Tax=Plakobranchus ocellatus TaxID=259542 RepID=A0AAV4BLS3_9GAST|nr:hypothetical protein PoB_004679200 [Plakobranchus ocellatus]
MRYDQDMKETVEQDRLDDILKQFQLERISTLSNINIVGNLRECLGPPWREVIAPELSRSSRLRAELQIRLLNGDLSPP